jgi:ABC-type hemin transport system substrate-binding protein
LRGFQKFLDAGGAAALCGGAFADARRGAWRVRAVGAIVVWALCAVAACGPTGGGSGGEAGSGGADAPRVVALSPAIAATVRALGRGERLVGRHRYDHADTALPAVGDNLDVDTEALVAVRPTLVLMEAAATEPPAGLAATCERIGAALERVPMLSLGELVRAVEEIDELTAAPGEAIPSEAARTLAARFEAAFARDERAGARLGRTLIVAATEPIGVTGPGSFHHDLVASIGGEPVPEAGAAWMSLSAEDAAALEPDTVLLITTDASETGAEDAARRLPALAKLLPDVFSRGRVIVVNAEDALLPGPGLIGVAERIKAGALTLPVIDEADGGAARRGGGDG